MIYIYFTKMKIKNSRNQIASVCKTKIFKINNPYYRKILDLYKIKLYFNEIILSYIKINFAQIPYEVWNKDKLHTQNMNPEEQWTKNLYR